MYKSECKLKQVTTFKSKDTHKFAVTFSFSFLLNYAIHCKQAGS